MPEKVVKYGNRTFTTVLKESLLKFPVMKQSTGNRLRICKENYLCLIYCGHLYSFINCFVLELINVLVSFE